VCDKSVYLSGRQARLLILLPSNHFKFNFLNLINKTILLFLFFFTIAPSIAQEFIAQNFPSLNVGHSQVYTLLEDSRGHIWIGTWGGGLTRYDGQEFQKFNGNHRPAGRYISALYEDHSGQIWIGGAKTLTHFDGTDFYNHPFPESVQRITDILETPDHQLWVATDRGLFHLKNNKFQPVPTLPKNIFVEDLFLASDKILWLATTEGAFYFSNNTFKKIDDTDGLNRNHIRAITATPDGRIWLATITGGINIFDGQTISRFMYSDNLEEGLGINTLHTDPQGRVWVGLANEGAYRFDPRDSTQLWLNERKIEGLESDNVKVILSDQWGNYWLGTSGGGLTKYAARNQRFNQYTEADGLADKEIYAISADREGQFWLGTSRGIVTYDGTTFTNFSRDRNFADTKCRAICIDQKNQIWIGTEGDGLKMYDGNSYRQFQPWDGIEGQLIQDIIEDSLGNIWIAMMDAGITRLSIDPRDSTGQTFQTSRFTQKNGLPINAIYDLHLDQWQRLWYATRGGGIGYLENDSTLVNFDRNDGLPDLYVRTLTEDSLGYLWGGTANGGIFNVHLYGNQPVFSTFTETDGLTSNNIYAIVFQSENELWVGNQLGVDYITVSSGRDELGTVEFKGAAAGFTGGETCESAVLRSGETTWFGTIGGLMKYTPRDLEKNTIPPHFSITNLRLSYDSLARTAYANVLNHWGQIDSTLRFQSGDNNLNFEYKGIHLGQTTPIMYQWKMDGLTTDWSVPQAIGQSAFPYLPPGSYVFRARAVNAAGIASKEQSIAFSIQPPFWETWWFRIGSIVLALLLIGLFFTLRIRAVRQEARQKTERLELEKHLLELEQKALQLQMNPHFIFNVLNTIQSKINATDHRDARYQLAKFSKLMRATLENSRETAISLEAEIQSLENYLAMEKMSRNNSFDYSIERIGTTDSETPIPPMLIQPFVENAIIHGVAHVAEGGKITVTFTQRNGFLEGVITDNGIGRAAAQARKSQQDAHHKSVALAVTRERLELLNQQLGDLKRLEIADIIENGVIGGTRVVVRV